jgi:hypothetical protein
MRVVQNDKIAQTLRPEGVWGPSMRNESVNNVGGRRPHTFFSLLLRNLGPQSSSGPNFCAISRFFFCFVFVLAYLGEWTNWVGLMGGF